MSKEGKSKKGKGKQVKTGQKAKANKTVTAKAKTRSKKLLKQAEQRAKEVAPKVVRSRPFHVGKRGASGMDPDRPHSGGAATSTMRDPLVRP